MINKKLTFVQSALTDEKDGLIVLPGTTIQGMAKLYEESNGRRDRSSGLSHDNIASPQGTTAAYKKYLDESAYQSPVNQSYYDSIHDLYLMLAAAPYYGWKITPVLYETGNDSTGRVYKSFFSRIRGYDRDPDRILVIRINDRNCGVFDAESGILFPTGDFKGLPEDLAGYPDAQAFKAGNPQIVKRMNALIKMICAQLQSPYDGQLRSLFKDLETVIENNKELDETVRLLMAEPKAPIPNDVRSYLSRVTGFANIGLVCGWPGENTGNILFEKPCLMVVPSDSVSAERGLRIRKDLEMVLPLAPGAERPDRIICVSGKAAGGKEWAEVVVELQGKVHHRVYSLDTESCNIANPNAFVNMQANVPIAPFRKFNYLERGSTAAVLYTDMKDTCWELQPVDRNEVVDQLSSYQDSNITWWFHQRRVPVTHMVLKDLKGTVLGTRYLPIPAPFMNKANTRHVAFDLGSSRSVRLTTVKGTGLFDPPAASLSKGEPFTENTIGGSNPFMMPMTTMSPKDLREIEEFSFDELDNNEAYIEPLVQSYNCLSEGANPKTTDLLARTRLWRPDSDILFDALVNDTGTMEDARTRIGVDAAPKERLSESGLSPENLEAAQKALRFYISTLFMESIYQAACEGYVFANGNLKFGVSLPDNGSDTGLTREVREAILGAAEYVNSYLTADNHLIEKKNLFLFAENLATQVWHTKNPPEDKLYLGNSVAMATSDCGNTTLDFTLAVNGHAYSCSIPYAGHNITVASLCEAYKGKFCDLVECFPAVSPDLERKAKDALKAVAETNQNNKNRLDKKLGFSMTLGQLFNKSVFRITGPNADPDMHRAQKLISIREYVSIPAVAATIARAVRKGDINITSDVYIAPVGRGSLALDSTLKGFKANYVGGLKMQLKQLLGQEYTGTIRFMSNNDADKRSVAEGILYMMEATTPGLNNIPVYETREELESHYLDMAYGESSTEEKAKRQRTLRGLDNKEGYADYKDAFDALYEDAFTSLVNNYSYEDFENSFNTWGLTGKADDGKTDRMIRNAVRQDFDNMLSEAKDERKNLIMAYPGVEKELLGGSLLDICLYKIAAEI